MKTRVFFGLNKKLLEWYLHKRSDNNLPFSCPQKIDRQGTPSSNMWWDLAMTAWMVYVLNKHTTIMLYFHYFVQLLYIYIYRILPAVASFEGIWLQARRENRDWISTHLQKKWREKEEEKDERRNSDQLLKKNESDTQYNVYIEWGLTIFDIYIRTSTRINKYTDQKDKRWK